MNENNYHYFNMYHSPHQPGKGGPSPPAEQSAEQLNLVPVEVTQHETETEKKVFPVKDENKQGLSVVLA